MKNELQRRKHTAFAALLCFLPMMPLPVWTETMNTTTQYRGTQYIPYYSVTSESHTNLYDLGKDFKTFPDKQAKGRLSYIDTPAGPVTNTKVELETASISYLGDVNGDRTVTITDVILMVAYILGEESGGFIAANADVNNDGSITITDVAATVAIILNGGGSIIAPPTQAYLTCPDDNHPHVIDLGLPSGIKWSCCNVDASKPEGYGGYYSWGETEEKELYDWSTYIHCRGTYNSSYYIGDDLAGTPYDVAHVKWGGGWVMPSLEQIKELLDNCTSEWVTINFVNGRRFTSNVNGGCIFLPAAGGFWIDEIYNAGNGGEYWVSTQYEKSVIGVYCLRFYSTKAFLGSDDNKYEGRCVRPVTNISTIPPLYLSSSTLCLLTEHEDSVEIASGSGNYTVESHDESIATATIQGGFIHVTAIRSGNASITVTDTTSGLTADLDVMVDPSFTSCPDEKHPHIIDLGLPSGTKWACCNIGASTPDGSGGYYSWGETEEKEDYNNVNYLYSTGEDSDGDGWYEDYHDFDEWGETQYIGDDIAGTPYDVAHVKWRASWVMPSIDQIRELVDNSTSEWVTQNGVYGRRFTSSANGGNIFMPVTGLYIGNHLNSPSGGSYWSSSQHPSQLGYAFTLFLYENSAYCNDGETRCLGLGIRPVWSP